MEVKLSKAVLLLLLLLVWLVTSACACSELSQRALEVRKGLTTQTAVVTTAEPGSTAAPQKAATLRGTDEPGTFTIEFTEADIREMLANESLHRDTITILVEDVTLGEGQVRVAMQVSESETGLDVGVNVLGEPYAKDGKAYVRVISFALDESVSGFARMLAQAAIQEAIDQATDGQGIPVPVNDVEVLSVDVQPGVIVIRGRRP